MTCEKESRTVFRTVPVLLATAVALAGPAALHAQQRITPATPAPTAAVPPNEATQLQQRIARLEQQARQDPSVKPALDAFETALQTAMARLDPQAPEKSARANALNHEVEEARAAADNAKLNQLAAEAAALKAYFDALRPRALAEADVRQARQAYLARAFERMKQIDPQAQAYVDRLAELRRGAGARATGGGSR